MDVRLASQRACNAIETSSSSAKLCSRRPHVHAHAPPRSPARTPALLPNDSPVLPPALSRRSSRHIAVRSSSDDGPNGLDRVRPSKVSPSQPTSDSTSLTVPVSQYDVDKDLWDVLDICTDEELELLYNTLHGPSPFSPVIKSISAEDEPALIDLRGRSSVMHKIESRFRFLAADSAQFLRGKRPAYRETLLYIRDRLEVQCSSNLATSDLEVEIFLHITQTCMEYVQSPNGPDTSEAMAAANMGDGMSGPNTPRKSRVVSAAEGAWAAVTAPIKFGLQDMAPTFAKLGSAVAVSAVGRKAAQQLGTGLLSQHLRYQAALSLATSAAASKLQSAAVLQAAQKGLASATARYGAMRGAMSLLGPVMWGWLAVDLAMKAIGTDYARIIRAVFLLAQVRLLKTNGFVNPA